MNDQNKNIAPPDESDKKFGLSKRTKAGAYTFVLTAVVLAVLVTVNLLVAALPKSLTVFDTSATGIYTVSESTKKYIGALDEDVTINWICQNGEEDAVMGTFLKRYAEGSPKLKIKILDPIKNPNVLDNYLGGASASTPVNFSLIIESKRRFTVIDSSSLFYYYNEMLDQAYGLSEPIPYEMYANYKDYFNYAENYGYPTEQFFYGDDVITKAVEYVTLPKIPHIYFLEGHGEAAFSDTLLGILEANNVESESFRLFENGGVPDDASCIVINAPDTDLSDDDAVMLRDYLGNGGNLLLITSSENTGMSNLMSLMENYGVAAVPGIVYDTSANRYKDTQYTLVPSVNSQHYTTAYAASRTMLMPMSHAIAVTDDTGSAAVTELFTTSGSAYSLVGEVKSDTGIKTLAVAITDETDSGTTQIVWYSSAAAFTDAVANKASLGNYYYMFYTLFWMNETYESALTDVTGISLTEPVLDGLTASSLFIWGTIFVIIVPSAFLVTGLVVWIKRRKR